MISMIFSLTLCLIQQMIARLKFAVVSFPDNFLFALYFRKGKLKPASLQTFALPKKRKNKCMNLFFYPPIKYFKAYDKVIIIIMIFYYY